MRIDTRKLNGDYEGRLIVLLMATKSHAREAYKAITSLIGLKHAGTKPSEKNWTATS